MNFNNSRKGWAILCPSKTVFKLLEKYKFFKTNVLEKSREPAFHCHGSESDLT
jgi:hypothetical protein